MDVNELVRRNSDAKQFLPAAGARGRDVAGLTMIQRLELDAEDQQKQRLIEAELRNLLESLRSSRDVTATKTARDVTDSLPPQLQSLDTQKLIDFILESEPHLDMTSSALDDVTDTAAGSSSQRPALTSSDVTIVLKNPVTSSQSDDVTRPVQMSIRLSDVLRACSIYPE